MEGLRLRLFVIGVFLASFGGYLAVRSRPNYQDRNEKWLEARAPKVVEGATYIASFENPEQSYRMDQSTYDALRPFGIVSRRFAIRDEQFDTVLIAGRRSQTFHNPLVCFTGSGYLVLNQRTVEVETKSHGKVPMTLARLTRNDGKETIAVFCYKSPYGFRAATSSVRYDLLWSKLVQNDETDGVFYRFIAENGVKDEKRLLTFAAHFVDEANRTSGGYF